MRSRSADPPRRAPSRRFSLGRDGRVTLLVFAATQVLGLPDLVAQPGGWVTAQSAHIVLAAPRGQDVTRLLHALETAYRDVRAHGLRMPASVHVYAHPTTDRFAQATSAARYNLAVAVAGCIHLQPVHLLMGNGAMPAALRHELVHVALRAAERRGLPRWMNEGMAMLVAAEKQPESLRFTRLSALEDTLARSRTYANVRSAYATAERLVASLVAEHGRARVVQLLGAVGAGGGFAVRFRRLTGSTPEDWGASQLKR